jgi:hypothetical protein
MSFIMVAVGVGVASAGLAAYSASAQADAQQQQLNYQSQVAANNAKIAEQQRSVELQKGQLDSQRAMLEQSQIIGNQRAALASNGVDLTQGSALDLLASTKYLGKLDTNNITTNAARTAWGYDVQSSNFKAQSILDKNTANNIDPAATGAIAGFGSLLGSVGNYAGARAATRLK